MSAPASIKELSAAIARLLEDISLHDDHAAAAGALEEAAAEALQWRELVDESARLASALKEGTD